MICRPRLQFRPALASVGFPRLRLARLARARSDASFNNSGRWTFAPRPAPCPPRLLLAQWAESTHQVMVKGSAHFASTGSRPSPEKEGTRGAEQDAALWFETPMWCKATSACLSAEQLRTPVIDLTQIRGLNAYRKPREDANHDLPDVLAQIDPEVEILHITGDTPSNDEWEVLERHFPKLRCLNVATGFDEHWVDDKFPLTWPLKLMVLSDVCGELISTPAIVEGRIEHLVLLLTCSLRFEGPNTKELMKKAEPIHVIPRPPRPNTEGAAPKAEGDESTGISILSVDHEWRKWLDNKYGNTAIALSSDCKSDPPSRMKKLEILGNDAVEMLSTMALGRFHLLTGLESLTIHSTSGNDLTASPPDFCLNFIRVLAKLKELKLTLGSDILAKLTKAADAQTPLYRCLPPNLETLRFRGPITMAPHLDQFAAAFADAEFLPSLKRISLVLDLPAVNESEDKKELSLEELRTSRIACEKVLSAAAARGVLVEEFSDPWAGHHHSFAAVDPRWAEIGDAMGVGWWQADD